MKTVNEVSKLTGISVRALHYYDQIGLFKPTSCTEAGYRLYDDKALERLQQILFFREFDLPLSAIKEIMDDPSFDKNGTLLNQKELLICKRDRLNGLIDLIDNVLKGENTMSFKEFSKEEIEGFYERLMGSMNDGQKESLMKEYQNEEQFKVNFMKNMGSEQGQENMKKLVEWYGGAEEAADSAAAMPEEMFGSCQKRTEEIYRKFAGLLGEDVHSLKVKQAVGEYDFVAGQMFRMKDVSGFLCDMAMEFRNNEALRTANDGQYGDGTSLFIADAILAFYGKE